MHKFLSIILLFLVMKVGAAGEANLSMPAPPEKVVAFTPVREIFPLLPTPQKMTLNGERLSLSEVHLIWKLGATDAARADFIEQDLKNFFARSSVNVSDKFSPQAHSFTFTFTVEPDEKIVALTEPYQKMHAEESYKINLSENGVLVTAPSIRGIYNAVSTLKQLLVTVEYGRIELTPATIEDYPAFALRGFLIDVGRNFLPMTELKKIVDYLARYKYNVFHFHCTEDPGWRLESKIYPQVNAPASMSRLPGRFYTQAEFIDFVEYCRVRNILVIPEMDMPGHTEAFRKAFGIEKMQDERATQILSELIGEMMALVPAEIMPYIHLGTDETKDNEKVDDATLQRYFAVVDNAGRRAIAWNPGLEVAGYTRPLLQMWVTRNRHLPPAGREFIDSQENYLNLLDPLHAGTLLYFRKNGAAGIANGATCVGGIICSWSDVELANPRHHFQQTHIFPSLIFAAENLWRDPHATERGEFFANLPPYNTPELAEFAAFENKVLQHRQRYARHLPFPYVRQSDIFWKTIGAFPHNGDVKKSFPVEEKIAAEYIVNGQHYVWHPQPRTGGTLIYNHHHYLSLPTLMNNYQFDGKTPNDATMYALTYFYAETDVNVPVWISGYNHPQANRGKNIACRENEWAEEAPQFFLNDVAIPAPRWLAKNRREQDPYLDENYYYRAPTMLGFKKGWNKVLVKSPQAASNRNRWQFTFIPVTEPTEDFAVDVERSPLLRAATPEEIEKLMTTLFHSVNPGLK